MQLKKYALFAVAALVATGLATLAPVQQATAQTGSPASPTPDELDPAECATTFKPLQDNARTPHTITADALTINQCRALVKFRNAIFANAQNKNFANHTIAQWGTASTPEGKRMNNWPGVGLWYTRVTELSLSAWLVNKKNNINNRTNQAVLGGPLPELGLEGFETKDLFPTMGRVIINGNRFTGAFPNWIYGLPKLGTLYLNGNQLSGRVDGSAFVSPKLLRIDLSGNNFSGSLPNFDFAKHPEFVRLVLSGNSFSGNIPAGYSGLADGRPISDLVLGGNPITGDIPSWVTELKFSDSVPGGHFPVIEGVYRNRIDFSNARLCLPDNFRMPTLYEAANPSTVASVQIKFARNNCATGDNESIYIPGPVRDLTYTISGNSLTATWKAPTDTTAGSYVYSPIPFRIAAPFDIDPLPGVGDHCIQPHTGPNSQGVYSVTYDKATVEAANSSCRFFPDKFAVNVSSVFQVGSRTDGYFANAYTSESTSEPGWNILHVKENNSVRDIGWKLGMDYKAVYYGWDLDNQAWIRWDLLESSLDSTFPEIGSSIITTHSRPPAWLEIAGLSSADKDLPVQLGNGWNMISAGGDATRPNNHNGAFFFDEALLDCDSLAGTLAVMRYRSRSERFDVELPCHPSSERTLTRGESRGLIEEIEEYDSLFVYFNSALPVCIRWDDEDSKYEAVGAGDC